MNFLSNWSFLSWLNEQYPGAIEEFKTNTTELNRVYCNTLDFKINYSREVYAHELEELKQIGFDFGIDVTKEITALSKKIKPWSVYRRGMIGLGMFHSEPIEPIEKT